jgi:N-acetylmuramoyl-L-alanine amidase
MRPYKSPNYNQRTGQIKYLIMHYTGMSSGQEALERLCDEKSAVSAHYLIEEDGEVFSLVDEHRRAWHAGLSKWENDQDINDLSIGIEIVNSGHPFEGYESIYKEFPQKQMEAVLELSKIIINRHNIKPWHILGHSDVAWRRKIDPGELFNWQWLSDHGVGIYSDMEIDQADVEIGAPEIGEFLQKLEKYGYDIEGCYNKPRELITAFQRHFRQTNIDGELDSQTVAIIDYLLNVKFS